MEEVVLNVENRLLKGKKAKRVLAEKKIPGIFYLGNENISVQADERRLRDLVSSHTTHIIKVKFQDGSERRAIINEVQVDPVHGGIRHFDLYGIREGQKVALQIPVLLVGSPKGVKDGGILQHSIHRIRVQCDPDKVPAQLEVDISELGIADSVHVKDIKLEGVRILDNPDSAIVTVVPPPTIKEETPEAVAAEQPAEPEVIGKTKKAEEEAGPEEPGEKGKEKKKE